MLRYLARRLAASALILIGVSVITFGLTFLIPADPVRMIAGRSASPQAVENIRHQLGLDKPIPVQYLNYVTKLAQGDLGRSYVQKTEVSRLIEARLPATLLLMAGAIFFEILIGLPAGILAATRRGRLLDRGVMIFSFAGVSTPQFVVGLLLLYVFANLLGWFPLSGFGTLGHLVLPALTLGLAGGGWYSRMMRSSMIEVLRHDYSRMMRSSMIEVLRHDYIRTARAKGLSGPKVVLVHGLRNAILPVIAMIGLDIGIFMSGAVVVESVFGWPGIGQLAWLARQPAGRPHGSVD
jgi:peptide/nickel transport system permease protein